MTLTATPAAPALTPVRPTLHFTPPQGWMNDPNGLVWFEGEYHLFYQYHPDGLEWGPMHWGHAVSPDLLHWQHLDTALLPDEEGMCFSGSAIVDHRDRSGLFDGRPGLLAFYTAHRVTGARPEDYVQEQCLAYSRDRGRSWHKYAGNPVIAAPGFRDFRDPKVLWHAASDAWIMALACGQSIRFYRSDNLLDWTLASEFGEGQGRHTPGPWECPDLFELPLEDGPGGRGGQGSRWVLVVGVGAGDDDWGSFTQYFVGAFDGTRFHNHNAPERVLLLDESRDFYAVQSWSDAPDGRRLAIAWMSNWLYANQIPAGGWRGALSFPRELRLVAGAAGPRLAQRFAAELHGALQPSPAAAPLRLTAGRHWRDGAAAGTQHGQARLRLTPGSRVALRLAQHAHPDLLIACREQGLEIEVRREGHNGEARFERYFPHRFSQHLSPHVGPAAGEAGPLTLEWLRDRGSLELLLDQGLTALTQVCLGDPAAVAPSLEVLEGEVVVEAWCCARLKAPVPTAAP